jgi:hypothetical protein
MRPLLPKFIVQELFCNGPIADFATRSLKRLVEHHDNSNLSMERTRRKALLFKKWAALIFRRFRPRRWCSEARQGFWYIRPTIIRRILGTKDEVTGSRPHRPRKSYIQHLLMGMFSNLTSKIFGIAPLHLSHPSPQVDPEGFRTDKESSYEVR